MPTSFAGRGIAFVARLCRSIIFSATTPEGPQTTTMKVRTFFVAGLFLMSCFSYLGFFLALYGLPTAVDRRLNELSDMPEETVGLVAGLAGSFLVVGSVAWLIALCHALLVRLPRLRAAGIGWPIALVLLGPLAAPFYVFQQVWRPTHTGS